MLRLVADTNIVVSALLWHGAPHQLFQFTESEQIALYSSRALIDELSDVLRRPKLHQAVKASGKTAGALAAEYERLVELVEPRKLRRRTGRDPDDEAVLACAAAAQADVIVSGDKDLIVLKSYRRILIVSAVEALQLVKPRP